jgi:hypothetical protein
MMNKKITGFLMIFLVALSVSSFQKKEILNKSRFAEVKITFSNSVKNSKMVLVDSVYTNSFGEKYSISKFRYYVSNVAIKGDKSAFSEKNSYHLIDEGDEDSRSFLFSIPEGMYSSLNFLLGVDSLHNVSGAQSGALDPTKDMFWTWNTGYVMAKLEGNSPSSTLVNHKYEYHIGGFSGKYNVLKNIVLNFAGNKALHFAAGKTTEIFVNADADTWWQNPNDIRIAERANIMTPGKFALAISENYAKMFQIEKITSN